MTHGATGRLRSRIVFLWRLPAFIALFVAIFLVGSPVLALGGPERAGFPLLPSLLMLVAAIGAGSLMLYRVDGRAPGALGFAWTDRTGRELAIGFAIGVGAVAVAVLVAVLAGGLAYRADIGGVRAYGALLGEALILLSVAAVAEEALFRGYAFQVLVRATGPVAATLVLSAAFAAAHARNPNVGALALANIFLAGILLAVAYLRTRSLWFASSLHVAWNWATAALFDLPVSGLDVFDVPLYEPVVQGAGWLTGGAFGPEGGVVGLIGFSVALLFVARLRGLEESAGMRALRPLVDEETVP